MEDALPGRVLVADDDPQVRELFVDFLDGQYEVEAVGSGEAALKVVSHAFDAVLLDRLMPGRSGGDVLAEIEARDLECPVAVVTSVEPEIDVVDMGFEDYLIKPVSRSNLLNTVDSLSTGPTTTSSSNGTSRRHGGSASSNRPTRTPSSRTTTDTRRYSKNCLRSRPRLTRSPTTSVSTGSTTSIVIGHSSPRVDTPPSERRVTRGPRPTQGHRAPRGTFAHRP